MGWWVAAAIAVAFLGFYAWWTARRLDRLHRRLDIAAAALDDQLLRRAAASTALAEFDRTAALGDGSASGRALLQASASAAIDAAGRLDHDREAVENALGDAIATAIAASALADGEVDLPPAVLDLMDQTIRASFARRFYNDAVRDVLVVRDRRIVRWLRLAGRAPRPSYVEIDDEVVAAVPPVSRPVARVAEP